MQKAPQKQCKTMQNEKWTHHIWRAYQKKKLWTVSPAILFSTKIFPANHEYIFVNALTILSFLLPPFFLPFRESYIWFI